MRHREFLVLLLAVLSGTGCKMYEPKPLDPKAELAALQRLDWKTIAIERTKPGTVPEGPAAKFDLSDGLDEGEIVGLALTINPNLRALRFQTKESESRLVTAGLWPNPVFAITWQPGVGGAPGFTAAAAWLIEVIRVWERSTRLDAATAVVHETEANVIAAEWAHVAEVREKLWAVLAAERTVTLLREEIELRDRALELLRKGRALGDTRELELSLAELEAAEVRRDLRRAASEVDSTRRELNRIVGLPPNVVLPLTDAGKPLEITTVEDLSEDELDRRLLAGRFELRAKEFAYERSEHDHHLAIYRRLPPLGVGPSFQSQPDKTYYVGPAFLVELPIFNQNQGEIAETEAARERIRLEYVGLLHRLRAEAHEAMAQVRRAKLEVDALKAEVIPALEKSQRLVGDALKLKEIGTLEWINVQRRALDARRDYVGAILRYQDAVIRLEVAIGARVERK